MDGMQINLDAHSGTSKSTTYIVSKYQIKLCRFCRLELTESSRYITARVVHWKEGPVLEASTSEWAIKKQLYRPKDISAYNNLGKVMYEEYESEITPLC